MPTTPTKTEAVPPVPQRSFTWSVQTSEIGFMGPDADDGQGSAGCADCTGGCIFPSDRPRSKRPRSSVRGGVGDSA